MKKTFTTIVLFLPFIIIAQRSLKKATIVTSANETLTGYVDDKEWLSNPTFIRFKKSPEEGFSKFEASELKSIVIDNGDRYISAVVSYEEAPTEIPDEKIDTSLIITKTENVLLLVEYASPEFSLYRFSRNNRQHFYIQQKQDILQELIYRVYTVKLGGNVVEREDNVYYRLLNKLFGECSQAIDKIGQFQFNSKDLIKILTVYTNECGGKKINFVNNNKKKGIIQFAAFAGLTKNIIAFKSNDNSFLTPSYSYVTKKNPKSNPSFSAGLRFNYTIPRVHQRIAFTADIYYNKSHSTTSEYSSYTTPDFNTLKTLTLEFSFVRTSLGVKYSFTSEKAIRPFVQAGMASALMINHNANVEYDEYANNIHYKTNKDPFNPPELKKFVPGFFAGAGISYKRFSLDYKFESTAGLLELYFTRGTFVVHSLFFAVQLLK